MKLRALTDFCIGAGKDVATGDEFDVDEYYGRSLIQRGWAVAVEPPAPPAPDEIETREPEPEHREPRTRRTSR